MQGGRVIKFNLMGAIFILIIIIAIIVGLIKYVPKLFNNKNNDNEISKTNKENISEEHSEEQEENKYKEIINIDGDNIEIITKRCESDYGYSMKYDVNSFYVEKDKNGMDCFNSLVSDTIYMYIIKKDGSYNKEVEKLNANMEKASKEAGVVEYDIYDKVINGINATCELKKLSDRSIYTYYLKESSNTYFIVQVQVGKNFERRMMPIIDFMIESFEIL